ncbi:MAG: hypothetical protein JWQ29_1590 [Phenylobacterium sp.]|nr:hypothetical protein [Phenylobacterium sp.]
MSEALADFVGSQLAQPAPPMATALAASLAEAFEQPAAVLFYGSSLRTGERDAVHDFYVLTHASPPGFRGLLSRALWPDVSYREIADEAGVLRAKVASMTLTRFRRAAGGAGLDTTIWTRFVQPAALVWSDGPQSAAAVTEAVAQAARTAAGFAAALGPASGTPAAFWNSLFRQTYAAEFRIETQGREKTLLAADAARYDTLLPLAWRAGGIEAATAGNGELRPGLSPADRRRLLRAWRLRRIAGRPLNVARLIKAAFTFEGAARYAAWKIERHTGVPVAVTPWRERHPILAAPGVLWRIARQRRKG